MKQESQGPLAKLKPDFNFQHALLKQVGVTQRPQGHESMKTEEVIKMQEDDEYLKSPQSCKHKTITILDATAFKNIIKQISC